MASSGSLKTVAALWWSGMCDALQLQRCVVYCVLDSSGVIWSKIGKCFMLNGGVYLASILWHAHLIDPAVSWLLQRYAVPVYSPAAVEAWQRLLRVVLQVTWLLPLYVISLIVSCIWYQQMAGAAFEVKTRQQQQQLQQAGVPAPAPSPPPGPAHRPPGSGSLASGSGAGRPLGCGSAAAGASSASSSGGGSGGGGGAAQALETVAQELYRVLLFLVFSAEVLVISWLPYIGRLANVVFLSWLYAFYCFDYGWSLQGVPLPERLAFFERRWAFFAGFGLPCTLPTLLLPFHIGSALLNLLFPVFVLVAVASDPAANHARLGRSAGSGRIPIFGMALRPTSVVISAVMQRLVTRAHR